MTTTYYVPRYRPADPRAPRPAYRYTGGDIRKMLGVELPAGYSWEPRPALTLVCGSDPTVPGPDERSARDILLRALSRQGAAPGDIEDTVGAVIRFPLVAAPAVRLAGGFPA
ncbi:hypothetical protein [Streptomyces sp. NPDC102437]|uniref:hypothetical protein n=1 Tax=Streptomyces sp. NPDC102437 TaxID=3366175 RepID=UPI0038194DD1